MKIAYILEFIVAFALGAGGLYLYQMIRSKQGVEVSMTKAQSILEAARKDAEKIETEGELKAKDTAEALKREAERDVRERQKEISKAEKRMFAREDSLDKKFDTIERKEGEIEEREKELQVLSQKTVDKQVELDGIIAEAITKIEHIAGMTQSDAKQELVNTIEDEGRREAGRRLKQIEDELVETAEQKGREILALAVQRYAGDYANERMISVVSLPSDDMKGRIIGKEGRNIRSLEARTGVDVIIDDTPGTVVLSSLNPIRREVARLSLEALLADGRIHPARIEDIVGEMENKIDREMQKAGEDAVFDLGAQDMHPELIKMVGKLKFRTSYAQNVLTHSMEVAFIAGLIAAQIGMNPKVAKRAGLLHDIGKAVDHEVEGSHIDVGAEVVKKYGEKPEIVESVATNHDPDAKNLLALIIHASDAISAARPGARREMYESYVQRITDMERIAGSFRGVEKSYAIQAGREIRVIVESSHVDDEQSALLSHEIASKIEKEVAYPGKVKVTVIRETRSTAFAS